MEEVPLVHSWWCEGAEVVFMVRLQNARGAAHQEADDEKNSWSLNNNLVLHCTCGGGYAESL